MSDLYRPSNGTEGDWFMSEWCSKCANDVNHDCKILVATLMYSVGDERYPSEWIHGDDGAPKCTAYEAKPK